MLNRALARKKKNLAFYMNWEINATRGLGGTVSPSVEDQGARP